jgi:hypothetical protein
MKRILISTLLFALAVPLAAEDRTPGLARPGEAIPLGLENEGPDAPPAQRAVIMFLRLDEAQVSAWNQLLEDQRATIQPIREEIKATEIALREEMRKDEPDPATVGSYVISRQDLGRQVGEAHRFYVSEFEGLLDEDQMRRLQRLRQEARLHQMLPVFKRFGLLTPGGSPEGEEAPEDGIVLF